MFVRDGDRRVCHVTSQESKQRDRICFHGYAEEMLPCKGRPLIRSKRAERLSAVYFNDTSSAVQPTLCSVEWKDLI